jgi:CBS domain-containing protein
MPALQRTQLRSEAFFSGGFMKNVLQIMKERPHHEVYSVLPDQSVLSVAQYMRLKDIGAVPVMRDNVLLGIVTERDMLNKVLDHGLDPRDVFAEKIMSSHLTTVSPDESLQDCLNKLRRTHCRHLPVVKDGDMIGIISARDILGLDEAELMDWYLWSRDTRQDF